MIGTTRHGTAHPKWRKADARRLYYLFVCFALSGLSATSSIAEQAHCADDMFLVEARNSDTANQICRLADEISNDLATCGLVQERPLTIEVSERLSHSLGNCLGYFDCEYDRISVVDPSFLSEAINEDSGYNLVPTDVVLRAVLTHELSHAVASQMAGERRISLVDQEYIAAAMELEFMEEHRRRVLLDASDTSPPPKDDLIDTWIYVFAPRDFGVNAWRHFREPENGCGLIADLIAGTFSFERPIRPELQ